MNKVDAGRDRATPRRRRKHVIQSKSSEEGNGWRMREEEHGTRLIQYDRVARGSVRLRRGMQEWRREGERFGCHVGVSRFGSKPKIPKRDGGRQIRIPWAMLSGPGW